MELESNIPRIEYKKLVIIIISIILIIIGLIAMFHFENELEKIGTYESINLLYMLISQAICGMGLIGLIVGLLSKKKPTLVR